MHEPFEHAKKTATKAQVEVSDLKVPVNQEKALWLKLEGLLAQGLS